jgi:hypothetical protein
MSKLIVGNQRSGYTEPNGTSRYDRTQARDGNWNALPKRRGMRPRHCQRRWPAENLRPLVRFLRARLNRSWDAVYSELCAHMDIRSTPQQRVIERINEFVAVHVQWCDGVLYDTGASYGGWRRLRRTGRQFYVDPRSGLLKEPPDLRWVPVPDAPHRRLIDKMVYVRFRTVWYAVRFERMPHRHWPHRGVDYNGSHRLDALLKTRVSLENEDERFALYGRPDRIAVWKKPLNRKELKQLGLWRS